MPVQVTRQILTTSLILVCVSISVAQNRKSGEPSSILPNVAAPSTAPLASREQQLLDEINYARANPTLYIKFLEEYRTFYRDKSIYFPDGYSLVSNEGVAALEEAIIFLKTLTPLPPLEVRPGMIASAKVHVADLQKTGRFGHLGSDGSKPEDRLARFGTWQESVGEDIVYDSRSARYDVIALIIDDGVATRGHRNNLFKSSFRVIGLASEPVADRTICVITFAGGFTDRTGSKGATKY